MLRHILTPRENNKLTIIDSELKEVNMKINEYEEERNSLIKERLFIVYGVTNGDIFIDKEKKCKYVVCYTPDYIPNTTKGYVYLGLAPLQKGNGKAYDNFRYLTEEYMPLLMKTSEKYNDRIYPYK